jgi:hypothetical protein
MEQHPIPQQISSYQFKLVGDMTLKQFFQVAGGVVISLIFYSTPLHPFIKWPFIIFFTLLGAALAFLPFEERPLERWIIAFFRSIYSPTIYTWKKTDKPSVFYTETAVAPEIKSVPNTAPVTEVNTAKLEEAEKSFLSKIGGLWNVAPTQQTVPQQQVAPATTPVTEPTTVNKTETVSTVSIPQQIPVVIEKTTPKIIVEEKVGPNMSGGEVIKTEAIEAREFKPTAITSNTVEFSVDSAPPSPPIAINTIVGQVMDQDRKIIEGAILEIKDAMGRPVRALKSNKAGHFIIVTPLQNGKYEVTIEKDGFAFDPVSFDAVGEMIPPIAIRGKKV